MKGILETPYHAIKNHPIGAEVILPSNVRIWPSCLRILTKA